MVGTGQAIMDVRVGESVAQVGAHVAGEHVPVARSGQDHEGRESANARIQDRRIEKSLIVEPGIALNSLGHHGARLQCLEE
jgi:hypothetical protein